MSLTVIGNLGRSYFVMEMGLSKESVRVLDDENILQKDRNSFLFTTLCVDNILPISGFPEHNSSNRLDNNQTVISTDFNSRISSLFLVQDCIRK